MSKMSQTILWVTSSPKEDSNSKKISKMIVDRITNQVATVTHRDTSTVPHLVNDHLQILVDEVLTCDTLVLAMPMLNGIPSSVKAWIDHIVASGKTFIYESDKVTGCCKATNVYIVVTCGTGVAENSDRDFITPYLHRMLSFIGMTNVNVVWVNNVYQPDAMERASAIIDSLF